MRTALIALLILICFQSVPLLAELQPRATITSYTLRDTDCISFHTGTSMGILIPAGQSIEFVIPNAFRSRLPNFARIRHRKDRAFLCSTADGRDYDSPWLSVYFHNPQTDEWLVWQDQFGPEKRSAAGHPDSPKQNTLYNFPEYVGNFSPDRIRVYNRGEGDPARAVASLHGFEMFYLSAAEGTAATCRTLSDFTRINSITLRYTLDRQLGLQLKPGECFAFEFPEGFRHREIIQVVLKHRKDPVYAADPENLDAFDQNAAYILCEARSSLNRLWYKWADRSSVAKFSEVRSADNAENETLHNCLRTFGAIKPDRFRLTNVGTGDPAMAIANVHELEIMFLPASSGDIIIEQIFTPETAFSDLANNKPVPLIGGGPRLGGKFPGAVLLGKNRDKRAQQLLLLPEQHRFELNTWQSANGNLHIDLPANCCVELVELALGDLDITGLEYNKDGYFGRSGQAQTSISIETAAGKALPLINNYNVGMAGIITCGGPADDYITRKGDRLLIKVDNDEAFLMGYRITLSQKAVKHQ